MRDAAACQTAALSLSSHTPKYDYIIELFKQKQKQITYIDDRKRSHVFAEAAAN